MARPLLRGVSYCSTEECREWKAPRFHLSAVFDPDKPYYCHCCRTPCEMVVDSFDYTGGHPFRQVRVEFDYDSLEHRYRAVAIVTNHACEGIGVHTFRTAMIKTEKRALEIAECRLSNLSFGADADRCFALVNFDHPLEEVKRVCAQMSGGHLVDVVAVPGL